MKRFLLGMVFTLVAVAGIGYYVLEENITIEKRTETHNVTTIVDGKVASSKDWTDVLGYEVSIDLCDGTYIGK